MKVLQLISSNGFFGAERVIIELSKELLHANCLSYIGLIGNNKNEYIDFVNELEKNNLKSEIFNCRGKFYLRTIFEIRRFIKNNRIDIIHSHGYKSNFYGFLSRTNTNTRIIATCHNWLGKSSKMKFYERLDKLVLRRFDQIVAVSDVLAGEILKSGVQKSKVKVINNGVDIARFEVTSNNSPIKNSLGLREDEKIIGTVGRLTEEKGHIYLFRAFERVNKELPNTRLLIVGDGPHLQDFKSQVTSLKLENKVIFTGTRNDIPEMLNIMDVFVLPSLNEGLPMALLEAMAAKSPVIATKVGAIPKVIENGKSGFLVEPGAVDALYQKITRILSNPEEARLLSNNAFEKINNEFSSRKMANQYMEIYNQL